MTRFTQFRIGTRLTAGFLVTMTLTATIGFLGMSSAANLADLTVQFHDHPFTVLENMSKARLAYRNMQMFSRELFLAMSDDEIAKVKAKLDETDKEYEVAIEAAKTAYLGDAADIRDAENAYKAYRALTKEIATDLEDADRGSALKLLRGKGADIAKMAAEKNQAIEEAASKRADAFMARAAETSTELARRSFGFLALSLIIGGIVALFTARSITRPVYAMTGVMGELTKDNLTVTVPHTERGDEIGFMAQAVAHFKDRLTRVKHLEAEQEAQKKRAELDRLAAMRKMADNFEGSVGKVIETVTSAATKLEGASGNMSVTANKTSTQATQVANSAQHAAVNVEAVASAAEELSASIREIAQQVERSQGVSARAGEEADKTTAQVRELSDKVAKIGEIVNLINDIASQTNLLALNATIEAARAGDAGKGFAVVAGEVKNLANQTARATSEIAAQISAVQTGTSAAVQAIDSISGVIGEMSEISSAVAVAVQQQTSATSEIARNVEQAATGTQQVSTNITSVEQAARDTGVASEQIRSSAADLSKQAEFLRNEVSQFLHQVRADKENMKLMHWTADLAFGVNSIDRHHQEIFDQINEFYRHMIGGNGGQAAITLLGQLEQSIKGHFDEEEALMSKHGYFDASSHRSQHRAFIGRLEQLRLVVENDRPEATGQLFDYVSTWMQEHIRKDDKKLSDFLHEKRAA